MNTLTEAPLHALIAAIEANPANKAARRELIRRAQAGSQEAEDALLAAGVSPDEVELDPEPIIDRARPAFSEDMADTLSRVKSDAQGVLDEWPEEAYGSGKLERAIGLLGECVDELERVADNCSPSGARAE